MSLAVVTAYVGVAAGAAMVVGSPILGTVVGDGIAVAVIGVARVARPRWFAVGRPIQPWHWSLWNSSAIVCGAVFAFAAGQSMALWLYELGGSTTFDESVQFKRNAGEAATLLTLVVAPIAEEMVFRGLLYPLLRMKVGVTAAAAASAMIFGLVHGNLVQFLFTVPLSVLAALVREHTGAVWPCVVLHITFNLAATLIPAQVLAILANPVPALLLTLAFTACVLLVHRKNVALPEDKRVNLR
ncbi:CPBP family intramembrane glutamic endopeptidase [Amycolatopsis sp. TNS106]|uniref:CPBP family intramembrane glutamic endopeptidase n=1 Tax=Amycolatopsis sp. TNS106 TaxID=2861750 RepID=UPI001C58FD97|nr:CPBP family intramembrane glutamic endopeptidase [Amycolatopsis sp. TNS106]